HPPDGVLLDEAPGTVDFGPVDFGTVVTGVVVGVTVVGVGNGSTGCFWPETQSTTFTASRLPRSMKGSSRTVIAGPSWVTRRTVPTGMPAGRSLPAHPHVVATSPTLMRRLGAMRVSTDKTTRSV